MAAKLGISRGIAIRILKTENVRARKHVTTPRDTGAKMAKRTHVVGDILEMYGDGMTPSKAFRSGETQVGADACARYNPRGERPYSSGGKEEDSVLEKPAKPRRQRAPGVLTRRAV